MEIRYSYTVLLLLCLRLRSDMTEKADWLLEISYPHTFLLLLLFLSLFRPNMIDKADPPLKTSYSHTLLVLLRFLFRPDMTDKADRPLEISYLDTLLLCLRLRPNMTERASQTPSTGLPHPSFKEEGAGKRCSECEGLLLFLLFRLDTPE